MRPELVQASELLRRNTPESIEQALGLLQNTVYSFSMKLCGHREDAEDTMQEVLFRSLKYISKVPDADGLAAWLYTVTRNRCRRMRRSPNESTTRKMSLDELMPDEAELQKLLLDLSDSPESAAVQAEQNHLLHQAVLRIPPSLRMVLVLHDMEELSTDEVARILDLQPGTVRVRLHRARLAVRKEMSQILQTGLQPQAATQPVTRKVAARAKQAQQECRELFANLSEYLDGRIEAGTCQEMQAHIDQCPACVEFLRALRVAIDRCRSLEMPCDPAVAQRMRALMTREYLRLIGREQAAAAHF